MHIGMKSSMQKNILDGSQTSQEHLFISVEKVQFKDLKI